ncbi:MAG: NAD(P)-binding protein [Alphaproteobacteria bacterium]|nr:NAD(P)-binding protein [Alphaproteobacteria bacterium]
MRIAIVGGGVSGLGAALALKDVHDVTLFEAAPRLGGHANTATIDYDGATIAVDTGFIVFNELNYPNLVGLLDHLGVATFESDMSFSVSDPKGFEWSSNGLQGLFAWKRNMWRPQFLCMLGDIVRFSAQARADLERSQIAACTLEEYVQQKGIGRGLLKHYLLPMGAAIWSTPEHDMLRYPAASFLRFFNNHRLLHARRPMWRSIVGGSISYVSVLEAQLGPRVRKNARVLAIARNSAGATVQVEGCAPEPFDHVICAAHSADTLRMLVDPHPEERTALAAIGYAPNTAYLHRDPRLMPRRRAAWASWNYLRGAGDGQRVCVTYWMNALQGIASERPVFVTLNPETPPAPELTFASYAYDHPQFNAAALQAQRVLGPARDGDVISYAGAWLGYGFHEDGLTAGLRAAEALGGRAPWTQPAIHPMSAPAEALDVTSAAA